MKKIDMTKGNVMSVIVTMALPIMGSSFLQFTYNLVDMLWVGALGSDAVASIGSSSFFIGVGYAINALVVTGTGIKTAHSIGAKDERAAKGYINSGMLINCILALLFSLSLILLGRNFIGFLNINDVGVENNAYLYLAVSAPMMFFSFFNLLYTRILNCYGNNKAALKISASGIIINMILDPIFIYLFKFGVIGAAASTLIANLTMFLIYQIKFREIFNFKLKLALDKDKLKNIVALGFPMAFQRILFTLVNIVLARIIAMFGADAIAAQKIGLQIESVTFMIIGGLNGAISSFVGQNYGAKEFKRIIEGYTSSIKIGMLYAFGAAMLFFFVPEFLARIFVRDAGTIAITAGYLKIIAFSQIFSAIEMISNGMFTGIGKPKIPATISIIFTVLRIPMAMLFAHFIGVNGIWWAIALSSILKGVSAHVLYKITVEKQYKVCA